MVQRNQVDMYLYWAKYPLKGDFLYSPILNEENLMILSTYNVSKMSSTKDIIFMFTEYSGVMWLQIFSVLLAIAIIMSIANWFSQKRFKFLDFVWTVLMFALDVDYLKEINNFLMVLSIFLSFFCFFTTQYLLNSISTDMIVIPDPIVIQSYQDIIDHDQVSPGFVKGWQDYEDFKFAEEGTIGKKVWLKGLKMEQLRNESFLMDLEPHALLRRRRLILNQKLASIASNYLIRFAAGSLARALTDQDDYRDTRILISTDPSQKPYSVIFAGSSKIDKVFFESFIRKFRLASEAGIVIELVDRMMDTITPFSPVIKERYSDKVQKGEQKGQNNNRIRFKHIYLTLIMAASGFTIATIILYIEFVINLSRKKAQQLLFIKVKPADIERRNALICHPNTQKDS